MNKVKKYIQFTILVFLVIGQITGCNFWDEDNPYGVANVSPLVEQWRSDVERYAQKYGVSEYVELILAMIAQESGGDADRYPDIMQSSESAGSSPNAISDPQKSMDQGIRYFASLVKSGKEAGVDIDTILQSYNFGGGYISFIRDNYGGSILNPLPEPFPTKWRPRWDGADMEM